MAFLAREFPSWLPRYERLYAGKYAPEDYRREIQAMVSTLQQKHGLRPRSEQRRADMPVGPEQPVNRPEAQVGFRW